MAYYNARKNAVIRAILAMVAVVLGVVATLVSYSLLKDDNDAIKVLKGIGIGVVAFLITTGVGYSIFAVAFKRRVFAVVSTACTWLSVIIILLLCNVLWWITVIIALAMLIFCTLILLGAYSEQLTVIPDNAKPDYKDYKTREAEKKNNPEVKEKEELPEIKSFE